MVPSINSKGQKFWVLGDMDTFHTKKFTEAERKLNDLKADADSMPPVIKAIDKECL
jgi:hypothetical protein